MTYMFGKITTFSTKTLSKKSPGLSYLVHMFAGLAEQGLAVFSDLLLRGQLCSQVARGVWETSLHTCERMRVEKADSLLQNQV